MKIVIIIQARMGSTRMPNKVLKPFYFSSSILEIIIKNVKEAFVNLPIYVATTLQEKDDAVADLTEQLDVNLYRGSESNVLSRFTDIIEKESADFIIRICADNPFLDMNDLKELINHITPDYDYISYKTDDKPTILTHYGFWAEIVNAKTLLDIGNQINEAIYLEHVTNYIHTAPNNFNLKLLSVHKSIPKDLRLTIDTQEDFEVAQKIYSNLKDSNKAISIDSVVEIVKHQDDLLNSMKIQKEKNSK